MRRPAESVTTVPWRLEDLGDHSRSTKYKRARPKLGQNTTINSRIQRLCDYANTLLSVINDTNNTDSPGPCPGEWKKEKVGVLDENEHLRSDGHNPNGDNSVRTRPRLCRQVGQKWTGCSAAGGAPGEWPHSLCPPMSVRAIPFFPSGDLPTLRCRQTRHLAPALWPHSTSTKTNQHQMGLVLLLTP
jgi:hypothetical protein